MLKLGDCTNGGHLSMAQVVRENWLLYSRTKSLVLSGHRLQSQSFRYDSALSSWWALRTLQASETTRELRSLTSTAQSLLPKWVVIALRLFYVAFIRSTTMQWGQTSGAQIMIPYQNLLIVGPSNSKPPKDGAPWWIFVCGQMHDCLCWEVLPIHTIFLTSHGGMGLRDGS